MNYILCNYIMSLYIPRGGLRSGWGFEGRSARACRMRARLWPPRLPATRNQGTLSTTARSGSGMSDAEGKARLAHLAVLATYAIGLGTALFLVVELWALHRRRS